MRPAVMRCEVCDVEVRGRFRETQFDALSTDDLAFLEQYLLAEFSIKNLEERVGMGYTAIRSRLDRIIEVYRRLNEAEDAKRAILKRLEEGEITAQEAAKAIARLA